MRPALFLLLLLGLSAGSALAQPPWARDRHMTPEQRRELREDLDRQRRDGYRDRGDRNAAREERREAPRMSPEEREKLRRDIMDANRDLRRRR